jgi:hypothetical protein
VVTAAAVVMGVSLVACGTSSGPPQIADEQLEERIRYAESVVGFHVVLPEYLPPSTQPLPGISVNPPDSVELEFFPSEDTSPVILLTESRSEFDPPPPGTPGVRVVKVDSASVTYQSGITGKTTVFLAAFWRDGGLSWEALFQWQSEESAPTSEMEDQATRVIESLVATRD